MNQMETAISERMGYLQRYKVWCTLAFVLSLSVSWTWSMAKGMMYFGICAQPQCVMNLVNGKRVNFELYPMVYMYRQVCPDLERKIWEQMHAVDGVYHDTYIEHKLSDCHIFSWDINFKYIVFHKVCALVYTLVTDLVSGSFSFFAPLCKHTFYKTCACMTIFE